MSDVTAPDSPRLLWSRLTAADTDDLHTLGLDPHIRRFLLDGEVVPRGWADDELTASDLAFDRFGVGLWLVRLRADGPASAPIGFCGFRHFPDLHEDAPELLYAFVEAVTGRGLATEAGGALVAFGRSRLPRLVSAVDQPNAASIRVLTKLGFRRHGAVPGEFGDIVLFERPRGAPND